MTTTWHHTLTWADFLAMRTGYPIYTMTVAAAYLLLLSLLLPGNVRVWGGIAREAAVSLYWLAWRTGRAVTRSAQWAAGRFPGTRLPVIGPLLRARQAVRDSRRSPDFRCPCPRCANTL